MAADVDVVIIGAGAAQAIGLTNSQRIVVYDNSTGIWAARLVAIQGVRSRAGFRA